MFIFIITATSIIIINSVFIIHILYTILLHANFLVLVLLILLLLLLFILSHTLLHTLNAMQCIVNDKLVEQRTEHVRWSPLCMCSRGFGRVILTNTIFTLYSRGGGGNVSFINIMYILPITQQALG